MESDYFGQKAGSSLRSGHQLWASRKTFLFVVQGSSLQAEPAVQSFATQSAAPLGPVQFRYSHLSDQSGTDYCASAVRPRRQVDALDDRIQPLNLSISETVDEVIVHHADRLHVRINDGRTNEAKSPVFEGLAKRVRFT
jgi:hypothetical protein